MRQKGKTMLTRKISKQAKLMLLFVILPLYLYCGTLIASAMIKFVVVSFSLVIDENTLNVYLNLGLDCFFVVIGFLVLKDSLIEQWKDFLKNLKDNLIWACLTGTALIYAAGLIGSLISLIFGMNVDSQNQQMVETLVMGHPLLMIVTSVVFAPMFEEILFRGMIFSWLYEVNPYFGHLVSAFLFGFVHVMNALMSGQTSEWLQIFSYMFMGGALSYLYEKRNNLFVPITTHMLNNLISILLIFFQ